MRKLNYIFLLFALILVSAFIGCADEPLETNAYLTTLGSKLTIDLSMASLSKGDIIWQEIKVILVTIKLTDPSGWVQSAQVNPDSPTTVTFQTRMNGIHLLQVNEYSTNTNGTTNLSTNAASMDLRSGYNYYVQVTIGGNVIIIIDTNTNVNTNTNSNTNTNTNAGGPASFGIYSDTVPISVLWDTDTKLDIWNDSENNIPMTLSITDQTNTSGDGGKAWKINGLSPTIYWIGMGIRVNPLTAYRDLRAFTNGSLNFMFRGTRAYKVGLKDGNGVQQWIKPIQMSVYGLKTNDTWGMVSIPLKKFDKIDFSKIQQYFMWTADTTMGYTTNRTYYIDDIYFTNAYGGPFDNYSETNFGIYGESVEQSINMNYDTELSIWTNDGGGMTLSDDPSDVGEGTRSWKITGTGVWEGFGIFDWPGDIYKDMSGYSNGAVHFMYKGTKAIAKIGAQSRRTDNLLWDAYVPGFDLLKYFGLKTNNTWCDVVIPMSYLRWKGLDVSRVFEYFYFAQDKGAGYSAGDVCRIDNIYWTKTPGGNMSWTTNTNIKGYGLYSETVPLGIIWDTDMALYVWTTYSGNMRIDEIVGGAPEGLRYWKFTGTGAWMGMGLTSIPGMKDMTAYANGHLNFMFKSTNTFTKITVQWESCGNSYAAFTPAELAAYGLRLDGTWCQVSIPLSAVKAKGWKPESTKIYFAFVSDGANYYLGVTYYLDNIYYTLD